MGAQPPPQMGARWRGCQPDCQKAAACSLQHSPLAPIPCHRASRWPHLEALEAEVVLAGGLQWCEGAHVAVCDSWRQAPAACPCLPLAERAYCPQRCPAGMASLRHAPLATLAKRARPAAGPRGRQRAHRDGAHAKVEADGTLECVVVQQAAVLLLSGRRLGLVIGCREDLRTAGRVAARQAGESRWPAPAKRREGGVGAAASPLAVSLSSSLAFHLPLIRSCRADAFSASDRLGSLLISMMRFSSSCCDSMVAVAGCPWPERRWRG